MHITVSAMGQLALLAGAPLFNYIKTNTWGHYAEWEEDTKVSKTWPQPLNEINSWRWLQPHLTYSDGTALKT